MTETRPSLARPTLADASRRWFGAPPEGLSASEKRVLERTLERRTLSQNRRAELAKQSSLGDRLADRMASFGGSWTFIILFGLFLGLWTAGNLALASRAVDPYPFIFLNLMLSMLAAIQAPVIMMSQNRQAAKDRAEAEHDYEVNLKAEIEIMALHEKLDSLRARDIEALIRRQEEQIALLTRLLQEKQP